MRVGQVPFSVVLFFSLSFLGGGCAKKPPAYPVKGTVQYKGKMVGQVNVLFCPEDGKAQPTGTVTDEEGKFELSVPKGKYKITIESMMMDIPGPDAPTKGPFAKALAVYRDVQQTPLSAEVTEKGIEALPLDIRPVGP